MKTVPLDLPELVNERGCNFWDLRALAIRGGAGKGFRFMRTDSINAALDEIDEDRLAVVTAFHAYVEALREKGSRPATLTGTLQQIRRFFKLADDYGLLVSMDTLLSTYGAVMMRHRESLLSGKIKQNTYYNFVTTIASAVASITGTDATVLRVRAGGFYDWNHSAEPPQSLTDTKRQGELLVRICDELSEEVVRGDVPITISIGDSCQFVIRCRMRLTDEQLHGPNPTGSVDERPWTLKSRAKACADKSNWRRREAINLRIEAELLIFIGQTSMNLSQAQQLVRRNVSFRTHHGGYSVRAFKQRSHSDVKFEIFKAYRTHFDRYLAWLDAIIGPDVDSLFPILGLTGELRVGAKEYFCHVKEAAAALGIKYVPSRILRKTRINWLADRSGSDQIAAELAQHTESTFFAHYRRPSHQTSLSEITRFWRENDPFRMAPTQGDCAGRAPSVELGHDTLAPVPDCMAASGCLFCSNHRDVENLDYVWSLTSLRLLKAIELSKTRSITRQAHDQPSDRAIARIDAKLHAFTKAGGSLADWVTEAAERVREGHYHPAWQGLIALGELI